ncbi:MAG: hypothetical protein KGM47_16170 [Acidobacteriota bacterium]|nr:hypothetical protein [Acidobacteriota bacterium]
MRSMKRELEIIACSADDAVAAWRGGASRLEVTVRLEDDGLTPPADMVRQIVQEVPIPARIMLRETPEYSLRDRGELQTLLDKALEFASMGVEGFVFGYVKNGFLDLGAIGEITRAVHPLPVTVHNAIEKTHDPLQALRSLGAFPGVDRALVKAGSTHEERIRNVRAFGGAIGPEKDLILGGGLSLAMLSPLASETNVRIFHLGRAVRTPESHVGKVDAEKVRAAAKALSEAGKTMKARWNDEQD